MKVRLLLLAVFVAAPLLAQSDADLIKQGVALFDQGKIDEAIAKYQEVLAKDPANADAMYELAIAYTSKRDFGKCRALLEPALGLDTSRGAVRHMTLGNCLDEAGEHQKAIKVYREGLRIAPDDARLAYNLAVALVGEKQVDEARQLLERDVTIVPEHASGHFALARVFDAQNFRLPAFLEYLRFLSIEPEGERARFAADRAVALLNRGVKKNGKNTNITVDTNSRKEEGDFSSLELMLSVLSATGGIADTANRDAMAKLSDQMGGVINILVELPADQRGEEYVWRTLVPFFDEMSKRELVTPFTYVAFSSLEIAGSKEWMARNRDAVEQYKGWRAIAGRAPAIPVPPRKP